MTFLPNKLFFALNLIILLIIFPHTLLSQTKIVGELTLVTDSSADSKLFASVNGERTESGRSIMSPSVIETPASVNAKITFNNLGSVTVSPNSKINLSFDSSNLSGNLQSGEFIIYANPKTAVNFSTPNGNVTIPVSDNLNSFEVKIIDGKTTVYSILGSVQFNGTTISAGDYFPKQPGDKPAGKSSVGNNGLIIIGILGAVGAGVLLALAGSSGDNNSVSPVR